MKKKLLSLVLTIIMVLSPLGSAEVFALPVEGAFKIGAQNYSSLAEAVAAVPTTGVKTTIQATAPSTATDNIIIAKGKNIVLDLNGQRVVLVSPDSNYSISNSGTLTIQDNTNDKLGILVGSRFPIKNSSSMTVNSGTIYSEAQYGKTVVNEGSLYVNGGTIYSVNFYGIETKTSVEINGGKIEGGTTGIAITGKATVNLKDGEVKAKYGVVLYADGIFNMEGGSVTGSSQGIAFANKLTSGTPTMNISGGVVNSPLATGLFMPSRVGIFNMTGGEIKGVNGAVICAGTFNMTGGTVSSENSKNTRRQGYHTLANAYRSSDYIVRGNYGAAIQIYDRRSTNTTNYSYGPANVSISGGTIKSDSVEPCLIYVDLDNMPGTPRGTLSVSGGQFINSGADVFEAYYADGSQWSTSTDTYPAGAFTKAEPFISGGRFKVNPLDNFEEYIIGEPATGEVTSGVETDYIIGGDAVLGEANLAKSTDRVKLLTGTATVASQTSLRIASGAAFELASGTSLTSEGTLNIIGTLTAGGSLTNSGTTNISGELAVDGSFTSGGRINLSGKLTVNGTFINGGSFYGTGTVALGAEKSFAINGDTGPIKIRGTNPDSTEVLLVPGLTYSTDAEATLVVPEAHSNPFAIGGETYPTLAAAIAAVPSEGVQTTIKTVSAPASAPAAISIPATKNVALDLNGFCSPQCRQNISRTRTLSLSR